MATQTAVLNSGRESEDPRSGSVAAAIDRDDPVALLQERIERKRRGDPQQLAEHISRNWATPGFLESSPSLEQLREFAEAEPSPSVAATTSPSHRRSVLIIQPRTAPSPTRRVQRSRRPMSGDVYFRKQHALAQAPTFEVSMIDEDKELAIDKAGFAVSLAELQDESRFDRAMEAIPGLHDVRRPKTAPDLSRPATSRYTGLPARIDFFQLYKHSRIPTARSESKKDGGTVHEMTPVTARVEFVKLCHERLLPPVPFLTRCSSDESPALNLSGQGISPFYVTALSKSFERISFLKHVNLADNRLDESVAAQLLAALRRRNQLQSIVLDKNRIGAKGMKQLLEMVNNSTCMLNEISVADNQLTDVEVAALLHACLSITRTLTILNVSGNCASIKCAETCARLLQCDDLHLIELDLSWNTLRTSGAAIILQTLAKHPLSARVQVLRLSWNGIVDGVVKPLCAMLATQAVEVVRLDHNRLSAAALQTLQQASSSSENPTTSSQRKPRARLILS
jgi:hypothetical protein